MELIKGTFKNIWLFITMIATIVAGFIDIPYDGFKNPGENCTLIAEEKYMLEDFLPRAQGITTDGEYYYYSSNISLMKTTLDGETLKLSVTAIPTELLALGVNHIGGISCSGGVIYAALEGSYDDENGVTVFDNSFIAAYSTKDLKLLRFAKVSTERHSDGIPWVVADAANGVIYASKWSQSAELFVYKMSDFSFVGAVKLSEPIDRAQGGDLLDGCIYLSCNNRDNEKRILGVNPVTGEVSTAFTRSVGSKTEAEGMAVFKMPDGSVFHVLDIGKSRINVSLRHYKMNNY